MARHSKEKTRISPEEFTLLAIKSLRKPPHPGIHTVWTGFNVAFREYFPELDPVKAINKLVKEGKIVRQVVKGGARIYIPGELPESLKEKITLQVKSEQTIAQDVLKKMGLK